jgi:hypothetical protein
MGSGFSNPQISVGREKDPENFRFSGSEVAVFTSGLCPQHPFYVPKAQRFYFPIGEINVDIWQRYSTPKTLGVL